MNKFTKTLLLSILGCFLVGNAFALPVGNALQGVFNGIAIDGSNDVNVFTDMLADDSDSYWNITATGNASASFMVELAGFASTNTFGIYNNSTYIELFDGANTTSDQASFHIYADGSVTVGHIGSHYDNYGAGTFSSSSFGFYMNANGGTNGDANTWYSDSSMNNDGADHMLAYRGVGEEVDIDKYKNNNGNIESGPWSSQEFILAFEDLAANGWDQDYADMVVMVESVEPIPEPATMVLLGIGLLGLAGVSRRKMN